MKLLSVLFKLVHTLEPLKALFTQHFQVHGYNTRNKMIFMQHIITKSHLDVEKFHMEQDNTGIHCHKVSKMKSPSPSLRIQ